MLLLMAEQSSSAGGRDGKGEIQEKGHEQGRGAKKLQQRVVLYSSLLSTLSLFNSEWNSIVEYPHHGGVASSFDSHCHGGLHAFPNPHHDTPPSQHRSMGFTLSFDGILEY